MQFRKMFFMGVAVSCILSVGFSMAEAAKKPIVKKILYVPHDNRPISDKQTAEVVEKLGYKVVIPPESILGNRDDLGHPEKLWEWLEATVDEKVKNEEIQAAVISSDAMLYGSLVGSRKHGYSRKEVIDRAARFQKLRQKHPKLPIYAFSSIMRTPRSAEASGYMEPDYYRSYGSDIFRYTALKDKEEMSGLDRREKKEAEFLQQLIPKTALGDWKSRREKNLEANKYLIGLAERNVFNYLLLGRDDNAPYSQTHMENRHLTSQGKHLPRLRFQSMAGIDEAGMLLLTRAVNDLSKKVPSVFVRYNWGAGEFTVPLYSDEKLNISVEEAITVAGGTQAVSPEEADMVLAVNTNPSGKTDEAAMRFNDGTPREGTKYFVDLVEEYLEKGYPVAIADVAYANGSDNALMEELRKRDMLFRLRAYAGWNTATNSTGFVIGAGMLAGKMDRKSVDELLLTRYLDDWAYQANIRNIIARQLTWLRGDGVYGRLDSKRDYVSERASRMLYRFVEENLPPFDTLEEVEVDFPWNRMFESDILHSKASENFFK